MRIVAGKLGGRTFESPKGHRTHPMSEKVRGALFNMLGDVENLTVLDAFAGSGALSLEALSRGATSATAIDLDKKAAQIIQQNAKSLGVIDQLKIIRANASSWSDNNPDRRFDVVLLDPPYDDTRTNLLQKLVHHVSLDGIIIISLPPNTPLSLSNECQLLTTKSYGDAELHAYQRVK